MMIQETIQETLKQVEQEHDIRLLFACESGSRGWQFASPDSDYDVRFIYVRPYPYYLSVMDRRYDMHFPIDGDLDMYGWDIRKVLQLIRKSNTTPFEWLQSPIVYHAAATFRDSLWDLCQSYFGQRSNIHHYLGIAQGALDTVVNGDEIAIKKLFYVLRPLLSAQWCLERNGIAPMTIGPLLTLMPVALQAQVRTLIDQKAQTPEGFIVTIDSVLKAYIDDTFQRISEMSKGLPRDNFPPEPLDKYFIDTIKKYDH